MSTNQNAADFFVDRHLAQGRGERIAFIQDERSLSYAALADQTGRMASLLYENGFKREDRIALLMVDELELPIIFWGALKAGIIPIPLNTMLSTNGYEYVLRDCRATGLFISESMFEVVGSLLADLPHLTKIFIIGGANDRGNPVETNIAISNATEGLEIHDFSAMLARQTARSTVETSADECAFWLYSSGSTGLPKGVRHLHSSLRGTSDTYGSRVLGIHEDDVVFSVAKLFFAYGLGNSMTFPLSVGACAVLSASKPTVDGIFAVLRAARPTIFFSVPTMYASMLASPIRAAHPSLPGSDRLRLCVSAGEALPKDIGERWQEWAGVDVIDGVGSTEMLHIYLSNRPGEVMHGTSGVGVLGYEIRLVGEGNRIVGDEEIGELLVKGPSSSEGYWNQREKTLSTFEGFWTRTGDKYMRRTDGRYVYCGRTDDMFKVSGIWVAPFEVEQILSAHPSVLEAAVVPAEDHDGLIKPKAFVVLTCPVASGDLEVLMVALQRDVQERIGKWKYPRWIEFVTKLPRNATGKIQRFKLRTEGCSV